MLRFTPGIASDRDQVSSIVADGNASLIDAFKKIKNKQRNADYPLIGELGKQDSTARRTQNHQEISLIPRSVDVIPSTLPLQLDELFGCAKNEYGITWKESKLMKQLKQDGRLGKKLKNLLNKRNSRFNNSPGLESVNFSQTNYKKKATKWTDKKTLLTEPFGEIDSMLGVNNTKNRKVGLVPRTKVDKIFDEFYQENYGEEANFSDSEEDRNKKDAKELENINTTNLLNNLRLKADLERMLTKHKKEERRLSKSRNNSSSELICLINAKAMIGGNKESKTSITRPSSTLTKDTKEQIRITGVNTEEPKQITHYSNSSASIVDSYKNLFTAPVNNFELHQNLLHLIRGEYFSNISNKQERKNKELFDLHERCCKCSLRPNTIEFLEMSILIEMYNKNVRNDCSIDIKDYRYGLHLLTDNLGRASSVLHNMKNDYSIQKISFEKNILRHKNQNSRIIELQRKINSSKRFYSEQSKYKHPFEQDSSTHITPLRYVSPLRKRQMTEGKPSYVKASAFTINNFGASNLKRSRLNNRSTLRRVERSNESSYSLIDPIPNSHADLACFNNQARNVHLNDVTSYAQRQLNKNKERRLLQLEKNCQDLIESKEKFNKMKKIKADRFHKEFALREQNFSVRRNTKNRIIERQFLGKLNAEQNILKLRRASTILDAKQLNEAQKEQFFVFVLTFKEELIKRYTNILYNNIPIFLNIMNYLYLLAAEREYLIEVDIQNIKTYALGEYSGKSLINEAEGALFILLDQYVKRNCVSSQSILDNLLPV